MICERSESSLQALEENEGGKRNRGMKPMKLGAVEGIGDKIGKFGLGAISHAVMTLSDTAFPTSPSLVLGISVYP